MNIARTAVSPQTKLHQSKPAQAQLADSVPARSSDGVDSGSLLRALDNFDDKIAHEESVSHPYTADSKTADVTAFHKSLRTLVSTANESYQSKRDMDAPTQLSTQDLSLSLAETAGRTEYKAETLFKESKSLAKARKREVCWGAAALMGAAGLALYSATQGEWGETIQSLTDGRAAALGSLMLGTGGLALMVENRFENSENSLDQSVKARADAQLLRQSSQTVAAWGNLLK